MGFSPCHQYHVASHPPFQPMHSMFLFYLPEVILLDEPTSGLDTFTARYLMSSLADLAHNQGKIVLLTIHQPRSDIFRMFNQVGIMAYGQLVYFGGSEQMLEYFDKLGYTCPTYSNPTDHYGRSIHFIFHNIIYVYTSCVIVFLKCRPPVHFCPITA